MLDIRLSFHENLSYVNGDNVSQVSVFVPYSICASKIQSEIRRFKFSTDPENNEFLKKILSWYHSQSCQLKLDVTCL